MQKFNHIKESNLMELVRKLPCQKCGLDIFGEVVGAHANWSWAGKGRGLKAHDLPAALCQVCHMEIDSGKSMSGEEREVEWLRAFYQTIATLHQRGLVTFSKAKSA